MCKLMHEYENAHQNNGKYIEYYFHIIHSETKKTQILKKHVEKVLY